jgi:hypothetical protein
MEGTGARKQGTARQSPGEVGTREGSSRGQSESGPGGGSRGTRHRSVEAPWRIKRVSFVSPGMAAQFLLHRMDNKPKLSQDVTAQRRGLRYEVLPMAMTMKRVQLCQPADDNEYSILQSKSYHWITGRFSLIILSTHSIVLRRSPLDPARRLCAD